MVLVGGDKNTVRYRPAKEVGHWAYVLRGLCIILDPWTISICLTMLPVLQGLNSSGLPHPPHYDELNPLNK